MQTVAFTDEANNKIKLQFTHVDGDWTPHQAILDFRVEDQFGVITIESVKLQAEGIVYLILKLPTQGKTQITELYGANPRCTLLDDNCRGITPFTVQMPGSEERGSGTHECHRS